ncbi:MAG TPA: FAD-binding oxidoreductase [Steroidobacteraceae bacterium]|jgi:FAD/FMN-containing dehydrogenase|nr:FAD-binding oxidoreductase [Steroidobacteraceae bacterium]
MRRRTFCATGVAALTAAAFPYRRAFPAASDADITAVELDGRQLTLKSADVQDLRAGLRGELITAELPGYDAARRLWNPAFDRKPALIVRCVGAADVRRAVSFSAAHGLLTAVRGGGHSVSGQSGCDGGLVIDLSPMRAVEVDPLARLAHVEGGALLGQLDREALAFGLATPVGTVADTGVAGLTLGGGVGRIARKFGLTCDNLMGAEVVTADGKWLRVSAAENPDLLWALRGGGGNFGVVTAFTFRLHEVNPIMYGGNISYSFADARQLLRGVADLAAAAPDELYVDMAMGTAPQGARWLELSVCYCGAAAAAERAVAPLRKIAKPLKDQLAVAPYATLQSSADLRGISPLGAYGKGGLVYGITPTLIDTMVEFTASAPSDGVFMWLQHQGGAISHVKPAATAYFNRGASHNIGVVTSWKMPPGDTAREIEWVRSAWAKIEPQTRGQYVNLAASDDREARVHAAYGDNYRRLATLKKRYDPANLFRLNANIKPA